MMLLQLLPDRSLLKHNNTREGNDGFRKRHFNVILKRNFSQLNGQFVYINNLDSQLTSFAVLVSHSTSKQVLF